MSWGWGGYGDYEYVTVAEKKAKAQNYLEKLKKKDPNVAPVVLKGKKIAETWWGASWNKNLESYADYANRIGRGRSYVRNGMVLDLRIKKSVVTGLVMGTRAKPYKVEIGFDALPEAKWARIVEQCGHKIAGMQDLAEGRFPAEMAELFLKQGQGLFPSPKEIHMDCSCPDGAWMCKHVAAVLYAIGARFDEDPLLFFKLRDIRFEDLLKRTVEEKMANMLKNAGKKTGRILDLGSAEIEDVFGIGG